MIEKFIILSYNISKLTREGRKLGSRMRVGEMLRIPLLLGLAYFFVASNSFNLSKIFSGSFFSSSIINSIACIE